MLQEHRHKPITGSGLLIGRQTMPFSVTEAVKMISAEGVPLRFEPKSAADFSRLTVDQTRVGKGKNYINDVGFFSLFCDTSFVALDVTAYEGAEIVHDMHTPIPESLSNSFDFIWNGSCLDNMFDPGTAMRNTAKMLRPGGRVAMMEIGTPHHNAYTMYSPAFFFDFFAINRFADCKVYVCFFDPEQVHFGPFYVFEWTFFDATLWQFPIPKNMAAINLVIAEKGPESTSDQIPVQGQYRPSHDIYREAFQRFSTSIRPKLRLEKHWSDRWRFSKHPHRSYLGRLA
jgi:SAM-dependent methyltransferase